jgi:hypothetical protein
MMSRASARAIKEMTDRIHRAGWNLPPADKEQATHRKIDVPETYKNPTTGRNTKLGRRVEKPQDPKAGGPSGQTDRAKHNKRHANK